MSDPVPAEASAAGSRTTLGVARIRAACVLSWAGVLPSNEGNSDLDRIISKDYAYREILFSWEAIQRISDNNVQTAELS